MMIHTPGLHGELIEFVASNANVNPTVPPERDGLDGYAILKRTPAHPSARLDVFSTHLLYTDPDGNQYASSGHYDLTLEQAQRDLQERVGRRSPSRVKFLPCDCAEWAHKAYGPCSESKGI